MMRDTAPDVEAQLAALLRARSAGERLRMATGLFVGAKRLALAGTRRDGAPPDRVAERLALLTRLYGDDLTPTVRELVALETRASG